MPHALTTNRTMDGGRVSRRRFLRGSAGLAAAGLAAPYCYTSSGLGAAPMSPNDRPHVGCIGVGWIGVYDVASVARYADVVAVCDVDRLRAEASSDGGKRAIFDDYRRLLDRKDIDAVTISTPDHWHARIVIDAIKAGKDVFCQKPLTLTIDEGKILCKAVKAADRVVQVGTQQRSNDPNPVIPPIDLDRGNGKELFLTAIAMCQLGRIGKILRITCAIGGGRLGGPFRKTAPPPELNWNMWQGQAPEHDYIKERVHGSFRLWWEYAGGIMADWGVHHVDIAQWAIGMDHSGPLTIEPLRVVFPTPMRNGYAVRDDCYSTPTEFLVKCTFANGVELFIRHDTDNGILFEGEKGRFFVNRNRLSGKPVEQLAHEPIPEEVLRKLRKGKKSNTHMGNFIGCMKDRTEPVSDVFTHHRAATTCHLANIAIRLGRKLTWNPKTEQIVGDDEANNWQVRTQRKGFEVYG